MHNEILSDITLIFALSIAVIMLCNLLKVPAIVGFLLTGALSGPHGLGLVSGQENVEYLAEIGVMLLLFTIGIEFSFKKLMLIRNSVIYGGMLQVGLTIILAIIVGAYFNANINESIFIGFILALSSSAIILKLLQDNNMIDSPHGRTTLAILIFQDIIVIPMMLFVPFLTGNLDGAGSMIFFLILKTAILILIVIYGSTKLMPKILFHIAKTRSNELFLLTIIVVCFTVAGLTNALGLSIALGAFLAGLIISESEYSHQALGNIIPFRDVFTSLFFVSIGMLFDTSFLIDNILIIAGITILVIFVKGLIGGFSCNALGFPMRISIITGLSLAQVGEFSFVLAKVGISHEIISSYNYQLFLSVSILTMVFAPLIFTNSSKVAEYLSGLPLPKRMIFGTKSVFKAVQKTESKAKLNDHLIIVGYGVNGQNVARAARMADIPYLAIEMDAEVVKLARKNNERVVYGDAMNATLLKHANVHQAKVVVIALSDPDATRRVTSLVRLSNFSACIIVRNKYLREARDLKNLGANEVISMEFETSIEIFTRVLMKYFVSIEEIEKFINKIREDNYEMYRVVSKVEPLSAELQTRLNQNEISTVQVEEASIAFGKTLSELDIRNKFGVSVLAVQRNNTIHSNPSGNFVILKNDILVLFGDKDKRQETINSL